MSAVCNRPAACKRPAAASMHPAAEPSADRKKKAHTAAASCVHPTWKEDPRTTIESLRDEFAKIIAVDPTGKITVATFGADVSPVLGLGGHTATSLFPNMSYLAATVQKKAQAGPQLVTPDNGAMHVFIPGESTCLRHGSKSCLVQAPVDLLLSDGVVDLSDLVTALKDCPDAVEGDLDDGTGDGD